MERNQVLIFLEIRLSKNESLYNVYYICGLYSTGILSAFTYLVLILIFNRQNDPNNTSRSKNRAKREFDRDYTSRFKR